MLHLRARSRLLSDHACDGSLLRFCSSHFGKADSRRVLPTRVRTDPTPQLAVQSSRRWTPMPTGAARRRAAGRGAPPRRGGWRRAWRPPCTAPGSSTRPGSSSAAPSDRLSGGQSDFYSFSWRGGQMLRHFGRSAPAGGSGCGSGRLGGATALTTPPPQARPSLPVPGPSSAAASCGQGCGAAADMAVLLRRAPYYGGGPAVRPRTRAASPAGGWGRDGYRAPSAGPAAAIRVVESGYQRRQAIRVKGLLLTRRLSESMLPGGNESNDGGGPVPAGGAVSPRAQERPGTVRERRCVR